MDWWTWESLGWLCLSETWHRAMREMPPCWLSSNHPPKQETWVPSMGCEDPLEKEMATHPSIAWKISWTEKPGGATLHRVTEDTTEQLNNNNREDHTYGKRYLLPLI